MSLQSPDTQRLTTLGDVLGDGPLPFWYVLLVELDGRVALDITYPSIREFWAVTGDHIPPENVARLVARLDAPSRNTSESRTALAEMCNSWMNRRVDEAPDCRELGHREHRPLEEDHGAGSQATGCSICQSRSARQARLALEQLFPEIQTIDSVLLRGVYDALHRDTSRALSSEPAIVAPTALCLSGGGIRSATFCLGALQMLARRERLDRITYLSTVSGGGYIGSWLSAWIARERNGWRGVLRALRAPSSDPINPEAGPVRHLREFASDMNPRRGLMSVDTWTMVATYARNLLLNWVVTVPLLAALLLLPTAFLGSLEYGANTAVQHSALGLAGMLVIIGLAYIVANRPGIVGPPSLRPSAAQDAGGDPRFVLCVLAPFFCATMLLTWVWGHPLPRALPSDLVTWALVVGALGWVVGWVARGLRQRRANRLDSTHPDTKRYHRVQAITLDAIGAAIGVIVAVGCVSVILHRGDALLIDQCGRTVQHIETALRIVTAVDRETPIPGIAKYICLIPGVILVALLLAGTAFVGVVGRLTGEDDREWWARCGAWGMLAAVGWMVGATLVLCGPYLIVKGGAWARATIPVGGGLGTILTLMGGYSAHTPGTKDTQLSNRSARMLDLLVRVGAVLVCAFLAIMLAWGTDVFIRVFSQSMFSPFVIPGWLPGALAVGFIGVSVLASTAIDVNVFSLEGMYRNRLIRAYLAASRRSDERRPDPFTGFDMADNLHLRTLVGGTEYRAADAHPPGAPPVVEASPEQMPPLHVVNATLNLAGGTNLAWQERQAESFTMTSKHAGHFRLGYRPMDARDEDGQGYGGSRGMSLGTAMAISGAAVSPNMGSHSSPIITFLLTLFNARLGGWFGNPGPPGNDTYFRSRPWSSLHPLLDEMLGRTTDQHPYVYLSDGGHFDNLGLYEMILRRCQRIIVIDAGADPGYAFDDLANATRKISVDFGVPIRFDARLTIGACPDGPNTNDSFFGLADILYQEVDGSHAINGRLLYIKPALYETCPISLVSYGKTDRAFPNDSTLNQSFTESQFESYRALGAYILDHVLTQVDWGMFRTGPIHECHQPIPIP